MIGIPTLRIVSDMPHHWTADIPFVDLPRIAMEI